MKAGQPGENWLPTPQEDLDTLTVANSDKDRGLGGHNVKALLLVRASVWHTVITLLLITVEASRPHFTDEKAKAGRGHLLPQEHRASKRNASIQTLIEFTPEPVQ